jgi:hypothetical protein
MRCRCEASAQFGRSFAAWRASTAPVPETDVAKSSIQRRRGQAGHAVAQVGVKNIFSLKSAAP